MRFDVLGPLHVSGQHGPVSVPRGRSAAVLAGLVAHANERVSAHALAELVWARPPVDAAARVTLMARSLAVVLDPGTIEVGRTLRLVAPDDAVDAVRFERLVHVGRAHLRAGDVARGRADLDDAVGLWRGPAFPELERALPVVGLVDRLDELRLTATEDLVGLTLLGPVDYPLVAELRSHLVLHPGRPRLHRQLALALYRCSRQVEALGVLRELRHELGDDDGRTAALEAAILQHAPELDDGELPPVG